MRKINETLSHAVINLFKSTREGEIVFFNLHIYYYTVHLVLQTCHRRAVEACLSSSPMHPFCNATGFGSEIDYVGQCRMAFLIYNT